MPAPRAEGGSTRAFPRTLLLVAAALLIAKIATGIAEGRFRAGAAAGQAHGPTLTVSGSAQTPGPAVDRVHWRPIASARTEALASGKPILYDFTADWCPPCRAMQRELFSDAQAAAAIDSAFVPVRVLDRQREEGRNSTEVMVLQAQYHVEAFPTLVVVSPQGGAPVTIEGYMGRQATLARLLDAAARVREAGSAPQ
jgi:thiol:disulfide interchange protein